MPIPSVRSWPAPSNMLAIHFTRLATDGVHPVTRASTCPQDSSYACTAQLRITRRRSPKQLTSRRSKGKHRRLVGSPSNAAHLTALGAGCTGKRPRHPVFTRVAGQYSLFVTGRFTNFRYWESLTRLLDYKVFINLRDLRFCLEKNVTYLKELNIASQYRKFVSQHCFQAIEVAQFAPIRPPHDIWNNPAAVRSAIRFHMKSQR